MFTDQPFHPPQTFERPSFWYRLSYGVRTYGVEVTFNGMTSILNFIKISGSKFIGGTQTDTPSFLRIAG
jgi:hypothetical protein